jgi:hypothetical protein
MSLWPMFAFLLVVKLYEPGKLSTELEAQIEYVPRLVFFHILCQFGLSHLPLEKSLKNLKKNLNRI